ncbi:MAG: hypothetical protein JSR28_06285 [Proteobacteria bacterium]|nr:hypothetical protein [Pseudomonadota bacterium]
MKSRWLIVAAAFFPALSAAQGLPRFNVEKHCEEVSKVGGGSHTIYNGCIQMEQGSYNNLRSRWDGVSARIRKHCAEVGAFGGGSYQILDGCINMEEQAAGSKKSFSY